MKEELRAFDEQLAALELAKQTLDAARDNTEKQRDALRRQMEGLEAERRRLASTLQRSIAGALASALSSGVPPITLQRVASPEILPLVTDQELSRGGIHFSGFSQSKPMITKVTFARLSKTTREGIWRGYEACLQVFGRNFAPGCRIQMRFKGTEEDPTFGWTPNVYSGHYLELSTADSDESPIGDLAHEYRVVNPLYKSDWIPFTYEYDRDAELARAESLLAEGQRAMEEKRFHDATEPLRSAHVRLQGLVGTTDSRWAHAHRLWEESLYETGTWRRPPGQQDSSATSAAESLPSTPPAPGNNRPP